MKKILIITGGLVIIVLLGWLFFRNGDAPLGETLRDVLPFGSGEDVQLPVGSQQVVDNKESLIFDEFGNPTTNLFRLSDTPVAGFIAFARGTSTVIRYVDRATGHISEIVLGVKLEKKKITNQTLPKIYEAYFRPDGNAVLLRFLKDDSDIVENLSLTLTPPIATSVSTSSPQATEALYSVSATILRGDIGSVAVGSGNALYYSLEDSPLIVSSAFNNQAVKTILTSSFTNWRLASAGNILNIYTKASASAPGYAYSLNPTSGALTKLLGPLNGLTVMPDASGTRFVYSYVEGGQMKSAAKNLKSDVIVEILPVTLAEKCVWSVKSVGIVYCAAPIDGVGGGEPDNWYKGRTSYSDRIWQFDTNAEIGQVLVEPKITFDIDIDVYEPKLSPAEDYLIFMNKSDLSLWVLKLE